MTTVVDFPMVSPGVEISWKVCERVGDAVVVIKRGDNVIEMAALQALEALSVIAGITCEALAYCIENECVSRREEE